MNKIVHGDLRELEGVLRPLLDRAQPSEIVRVLAMCINHRALNRTMADAIPFIESARILNTPP